MMHRLLSALFLGLLLAPAPGFSQGSGDVRQQLGQGWTFLEAGNLRKAEEAFSAAFEDPVGRSTAEVYYAIAAVWWERRNAMAAYMWLADAQKASKDSFTWDGGPSGEWDQRIVGRRRYVESNFTVIKLRAPQRGKPLPPLADPIPADPLLREFTDRLPTVVEEGVEAKVAVQWVLLPNGTYWIGEQLVDLSGGQLDPTKASSWELPSDRGRARAAYTERAAALEAGRSMADEAGEAAAQADADALALEAARQEAEQAREAQAALDRQAVLDRQARELAAEREREEAARQAELERAEAERAQRELQREDDRQAAARRAEEERQAEERRAAEERQAELRRGEEERARAEAASAAERREAEERRLAEERRTEREERERAERREADRLRAEREAREAEEAITAERDRRAEELRAAEREQRAEELRAADRERRAEEQRALERERRAEETRTAEARRREKERLAEEGRVAERERQAEEARLAEEARAAEARREQEREAADGRSAEERRRDREHAEESARLADARSREEERERLQAEKQRLEDERWAAAARDTEEAESRRQAAARDAQARRESAAAGGDAAEELRGRRLYLALGGGLSTVDRLDTDGTSVDADWSVHGEIGVLAPLGKGQLPVALAVGLSYGSLPVAGCSHAQTRAHAVALHVAPRLAVPIKGRTWLQGRLGLHLGAASTFPSAGDRQACAAARTSSVGDPAYGVRVESGASSSLLSYGDLGWGGHALVVGPDFEIGVLGAPGAAPVFLGAAFFLRHDQVFAAIEGGSYHFRSGGESGVELESVELSALDPAASMPRFQLGARATVLF